MTTLVMDQSDLVDIIVFNAFNGLGDIIGDSDFGTSVAWVDLLDYMEDPNGEMLDSDALAEQAGGRWALALIDANGFRSVLVTDSRGEMLDAFNAWESAYSQFLDSVEDI